MLPTGHWESSTINAPSNKTSKNDVIHFRNDDYLSADGHILGDLKKNLFNRDQISNEWFKCSKNFPTSFSLNSFSSPF